MKRIILVALLGSFTTANAGGDIRYESVKSLGRLNGVALQCKYLDQVTRMKQAVVDTAPKERSFGLAFDLSTNEAFLGFIEAQSACPGPAGFESDVGEAIEVMKRAFGAAQ